MSGQASHEIALGLLLLLIVTLGEHGASLGGGGSDRSISDEWKQSVRVDEIRLGRGREDEGHRLRITR